MLKLSIASIFFVEEFIVFCPVTPLQGSIYSTILQTSEIIELVHAHQACLCGSGLSALKCCNKVGFVII